ncbi:hypothetical protein [Prevotella sp.]|uniref:hypothetical protein n=1 Tax=Prevotella sp. TaxID=59823 RepID=UPI0027E2F875|nr:hypothetical protein [Prevotella sp.]
MTATAAYSTYGPYTVRQCTAAYKTYAKSQEVCLPLYRRMRQMDKDGKKLVAEFVYWHAV